MNTSQLDHARRYADSEARPVLNDDDLYVIDLSTRRVVEQLGSSSVMAIAIRGGTLWGVKPGQALVKGMQARWLLGSAV